MNEKEILRNTVLEYLAERAAAAFQAAQIARMLNMRGMLDRPVTAHEIEEALVFLKGMDLVQKTFGALGSSAHWQITSKGTLHYERGE